MLYITIQIGDQNAVDGGFERGSQQRIGQRGLLFDLLLRSDVMRRHHITPLFFQQTHGFTHGKQASAVVTIFAFHRAVILPVARAHLVPKTQILQADLEF